MFEAIRGSAPRRVGQKVADPSGLFLGAVELLVPIGQGDVATRVHLAWWRTIEDGIDTYDGYDSQVGTQRVGARGFAQAVFERLGLGPRHLERVTYEVSATIEVKVGTRLAQAEQQVGIDVVLD